MNKPKVFSAGHIPDTFGLYKEVYGVLDPASRGISITELLWKYEEFYSDIIDTIIAGTVDASEELTRAYDQ